MATTRVPLAHPPLSSLRSLDETDYEVCPLDNGRPAVASAVRVLEDSAVYVATRHQLGYGGTCRFEDFTPGVHSYRLYVATEPFTEYALVQFGLSASGTFTGAVGVTSSDITPTTELVDVASVEDYTDYSQRTDYQVAVQVGNGTSAELSTGVYVQLSIAQTGGTLRVWYVRADPIPKLKGQEITI